MNILEPVAFALLIGAVGCGTPRQQPVSEAELRQRIARARLGMLHSEVEPHLPCYSKPLIVTIGDGPNQRRSTIIDDGAVVYLSGGAQIDVYHVSPEWVVDVQYDYSKPEPNVSGPVRLRRVSK